MNVEHELRSLALEFPPEPDLAPRVLARLQRPRRRRALVPSLAVVAAVGALLAIPQTRAEIFDFLRIGGEEIERVETQPRAPVRPHPLGRRVTLPEARAAVDFELAPPPPGARVYLDESVAGGMVNYARKGVVVSQWRGEQLPFVQKQVGPRSRVESLQVAGARGVWITGARHEIVYRRPDGEPVAKTRRLVGNVLVFERGGITYRIEGDQPKRRALAIARNLLRP